MCFLHVCISLTLNASRPKRYTKDDICHESQTTIEKVDVCPENIETLNKRSIKKNCSRYQTCSGYQLVYHCVMNGGGLVEVCAPRSQITGRFCPYYERGLGRVIENPRIRCIMCPFQYQSDEYLKISECVPAFVTNEDSSGKSSPINANITEPKDKPSSTNKGISIVEGLEKKDSNFTSEVLVKDIEYDLQDESVASGENMRKQEKHQSDIIVSVVVFSICSCLVLGISLTYFFRKRETTFCSMHEDRLEHINNQKDSKEPQFNDLCPESCEPMIIKRSMRHFDTHDLCF